MRSVTVGPATTYYTYDQVGNILSHGYSATSPEYNYTYDILNRLSTASFYGQTYSYTYDNNGNILTAVENGTTTTYTYNAANQLLTRSDGTYNFTYAYDQNGNMLAETVGALNTKSYTYDVFDQLVQATHLSTTSPPVSESYTYDGLGRRFSVSSGGGVIVVTTTRHFWDGDEITYDSVTTNGTTTGYNYLHGAYTEGTIVGSTLYGNAVNLHGDVTGTYQGTTKVNAAQFDAFGRVSSSSGTFRNPYGYSGEYTDATGLQYLRARYYNPELGRFTQQDTWRDQGNPYVYCSNNPVMYTDPSGHCKRYGIPDVKKTIWMISDIASEAVYGLTYKKKDLYCGNAPFYEVEMNWWSDLCAEWPLHRNMAGEQDDRIPYLGFDPTDNDIITDIEIVISKGWDLFFSPSFWKDLPNVIFANIEASAGIGVGLGFQYKTEKGISIEAINRVDFIGVRFKDGQIKFGQPARSAGNIGIGLYTFGPQRGMFYGESPEDDDPCEETVYFDYGPSGEKR